MQFPPFDHAAFLDRAWQGDPPAFNIGSSGYVGPSWRQRGLPPPEDFEPHGIHLTTAPALREAIADHVGTSPDRVIATAGTTAANLCVMLWAYRPGCNMVIERPVYSPLAATPEALGAEIRYETPEDGGSLFRLEVPAEA